MKYFLKKELHFYNFWNLCILVSLAAITFISLTPSVPTISDPIPFLDKFVHIGLYFIEGLFILSVSKKNIHTHSAIFLSAFGLLMEFCQGQTAYRSFEWLDLLANIAGILMALMLSKVVPLTLAIRLEELFKSMRNH